MLNLKKLNEFSKMLYSVFPSPKFIWEKVPDRADEGQMKHYELPKTLFNWLKFLLCHNLNSTKIFTLKK